MIIPRRSTASPGSARPTIPAICPVCGTSTGGICMKQHIAPVWLGEFGTRLQTTSDTQWLTALVKYLGTGASGINWTFWCWNPNSGDTGGILNDDWTTVNQAKQSYLNPIEFPLSGSGSAPKPTPTSPPNNTPIPTRTPGTTPTLTPPSPATTTPTSGLSLQVYYQPGVPGQSTTNFIEPHVEVVNTGSGSHQSQPGDDSLLVHA